MWSDLERALAKADLTYPEVGQTAGALPTGYHHLQRTVLIGVGTTTFAAAPTRCSAGGSMAVRDCGLPRRRRRPSQAGWCC